MNPYADPITIMRFMQEHFALLRQLYRVQLADGLISATIFDEATYHLTPAVRQRLIDHQLLRTVGDDYRLTEEVAGFLGFLIKEFRPLLPEQLQRYHRSIEEVYRKVIVPDLTDSKRILRLRHLYDEVQRFLDQIENNTATLLRRTQRLKADRDGQSYAHRLREARLLIEEYIEPINGIIDLNNTESIASLLVEVGRRINRDSMRSHAPAVLDWYGQTNLLLRTVNGFLQRQSDVIRRELTPLLERMQRESEIMSGWLTYMDRPFRIAPPRVGHRHRLEEFGRQTEADLTLFLEGLRPADPVMEIDLNRPAASVRRPFDRGRYRARLEAALPLSDFFGWCGAVLQEEPADRSEYLLLRLTDLVFGGQSAYRVSFGSQRRQLTLADCTYDLPVVTVNRAAPPPPSSSLPT